MFSASGKHPSFSLRPLVPLLLFLALLVFPAIAHAEIEITLNNSFIEKYKDRATIDTHYTVDKAHAKPNPPKKDGDLHIAGRAQEVGLPVVAEIMNAAFEKEAVDWVHKVEGTGQSVNLSGAWRLWCEHGGRSVQVQGAPLETIETTNPEHVFEIHPVTRIGDLSVADSFRPIEGFQPKDADTAFNAYENLRNQIKPKAKTTTLITTMGGYNYVEFILELSQDEQLVVPDGRFVVASVLDLDGELLVRNRRMVFVKGTEPEKAVQGLKKGEQLHVLGIPRIDLSLLSWRIHNYKERPEVLTWNLPYEIIIVAVYKE